MDKAAHGRTPVRHAAPLWPGLIYRCPFGADLGRHGNEVQDLDKVERNPVVAHACTRHTVSITAPAQDTNDGLQVFAIREARPHPWVISTTRHISQGGVSLLDERWDDDHKVLSGKSKLVIDDPYVMTVHLPNSFRLEAAEVDGAKAEIDNGKEIATVRIVPSATMKAEWEMAFAQ